MQRRIRSTTLTTKQRGILCCVVPQTQGGNIFGREGQMGKTGLCCASWGNTRMLHSSWGRRSRGGAVLCCPRGPGYIAGGAPAKLPTCSSAPRHVTLLLGLTLETGISPPPPLPDHTVQHILIQESYFSEPQKEEF